VENITAIRLHISCTPVGVGPKSVVPTVTTSQPNTWLAMELGAFTLITRHKFSKLFAAPCSAVLCPNFVLTLTTSLLRSSARQRHAIGRNCGNAVHVESLRSKFGRFQSAERDRARLANLSLPHGELEIDANAGSHPE
jgi:hypothetical protein